MRLPHTEADRPDGSLVGDRYRLARLVAAGGQGEIWEAHDERLDRGVAVKLLRPGPVRDPQARERFRREARTMATIEHPNIVRVVDTVEDDRRPAIVMELLDGESLAAQLRRDGPLAVADALRVGEALLTALDAAHGRGVVHRDVKPSNVIVTADGSVKLTDFGVAASDGESTITQPGTVVGSAPYLAPEQLQGGRPTERSDLYSASLVLYELLTGALPFEASTPPAAAVARLHERPTPLDRWRTDVPPVVADVVMRGLETDPLRRFDSAREMLTALRDAAASAGVIDLDATLPVVVPAAFSRSGSGGNGDPAVQDLATDRFPVPAVGRRRPRRTGVATRLAVGAAALIVLVALAAALAAAVADGSGGPAFTPTTEPPPLPCCEVPALTGGTLDQATARLAEAGLAVGTVFERESGFPEGTVLEQLPAPGEVIESGSTVNLVVADRGPLGADDEGKGNKGKGNEGKNEDEGDDD